MKPTDADTRATYTLNSDGSVTVEAGWKYYAIAFESPLIKLKVLRLREVHQQAFA